MTARRRRDTTAERTAPSGRSAPYDAAAERAVLGACLLGKPDLLDTIRHALPGNPFYPPRHATLWRAICALHDAGVAPDLVTVPRWYADQGERWAEPQDRIELLKLYEDAPLVYNPAHPRLIMRHARARAIVEAGARISQAGETVDLQHVDQLLTDVRNQLDLLAPALAGDADTWQPVDLAAALGGGAVTAGPILLSRNDGVPLLYPGRIHSLSGEPESGKTWIALAAVAECIADGNHALYLDFEDTAESIVARLLAVGGRPDHITERLHYVRPDRGIDGAAQHILAALCEQHSVGLAVIDGVTEAMTMHGLNLYDNTDAARFYEILPRYLTRLPQPPSVLLLDHVVKDEDRRGRYALGAQHKLAGLDGAAYTVEVVRPFAPDQPGLAKLVIAKDRHGMVRQHSRGGRPAVIAEVHVTGTEQVVTVELRPPRDPAEIAREQPAFRPTRYMERISRYLELNPGISKNAIEKAVQGKRDTIRLAIELLISEGFIRAEQGARRAIVHYSQKPFRADPDEGSEDEQEALFDDPD